MQGLAAYVILNFTLVAQAPREAAQRHIEEGRRALAQGRYQDAEEALKKARQTGALPAEALAQLGVACYQQGKFAEAVPALTQAIKLKPGLPNAATLLAMSLSELGRFAEALPGLERGFRQAADSPLRRLSGLQLTRAYTGLAKDDKAVETALELRRLYPDDAEVLYHTARLFGNFAFLTMQHLAEVAPDSVWRHQASAEVYESQEAYDAAIAQYEKVLAMDQRRPGIHFRIGRAMLARARQSPNRAADTALAVRHFQQELELDSTNANAAYELGEISRKDGQFQQARQYFEMGLKSYPDFEEALVGLARALLSLNQPAQAIAHLQKALTLNPRDEAAYYALGQAHRALGNAAEQQKALAEFRRLRDRNASQEPGQARREVTRQEVDPQAR